jgi:UDP-N-acetylmuramoyl-tripeptide--D-alanyl-D-alanine ligase
MTALTADEVVTATGGELLHEGSRTFSGVSIDSRTILEGEIFFSLRGEKFDGHDFINMALLTGNGAVVESRPEVTYEDKSLIQVKDTVRALQNLAHFMRLKRNIPVVAITGSNGKTTTKEMTYSILSRRYKVLRNEGNLNNHIGLPLSLVRISPSDEVVVLEMGMNSPGEIRRLCEIAVPTHGVITNIGSAHIGRLGSREAVREAKLELLGGLATVILNGDDSFLMEGVRDFPGKKITFSIESDSQVMAKNICPTERGDRFTLVFSEGDSVPVTLNVHGKFNVYNSLAASAVCFSLGMNILDIKASLEEYISFPMRFEVIRCGKTTVINDSYNANPSSVREALNELVRMRGGGRLMAVLGDMSELGSFAEEAHRTVLRQAYELGIEVIVAVGEMMGGAAGEAISSGISHSAVIHVFESVEALTENMKGILLDGDTVLVKGSRSMGMDRVIGGIRDAL